MCDESKINFFLRFSSDKDTNSFHVSLSLSPYLIEIFSRTSKYFRTNFPPQIFRDCQVKITIKLQVEIKLKHWHWVIFISQKVWLFAKSHAQTVCVKCFTKPQVLSLGKQPWGTYED